jgi:hypothetical protein
VRVVIIVALLLALLAGCAGARVVEATPVGGTLELHGERDTAVKRATEAMLAHCGSADATITSVNGDFVHYRCNAT